jgi:hypothetical protein
MIGEIILDNSKYDGYHIDASPGIFKGLNKINVFIGQNNTGKSRFLRRLLTALFAI